MSDEEINLLDVSDEKVKQKVIEILSRASLTLLELHYEVEKHNIIISYRKLKEIVSGMVEEGLIERRKEGRKIKYKIKARHTDRWLKYPWNRGEEEWASGLH